MYNSAHLWWCFISTSESHYLLLTYILVLTGNVNVSRKALFQKIICSEENYLAFVGILVKSIYLRIVSDASFSPATSPKGRAITDEPPPIPNPNPIPPCSFNPSSISISFLHVFLHLILPSYNWPSSPRTLSFAYIFPSQTLSLHMT